MKSQTVKPGLIAAVIVIAAALIAFLGFNYRAVSADARETNSIYKSGAEGYITSYNKASAKDITSDDITSYNDKETVIDLGNNVKAEVFHDVNKFSVDLSVKGSNDKALKSRLGYSLKALDPEVTDAQISRAWKEMHTDKYTNNLDVPGISVNNLKVYYNAQTKPDGQTAYNINLTTLS